MAWLEKDRHGRLRIGFKYYDGLKCREPLGVSAKGLPRDRALINRSLSIRYGVTTPKTKAAGA